jgi:hypothetical protein
VHGATYHGAVAGGKVQLSFRVSADGHRVQALKLSNLPIYCSGSGPPGTELAFTAATVSSSGTFTVRGSDAIASGPLKGTKVATLTVTGTFAAKGHERGVVSVRYVGSASQCSGHSSYATTG